MKAFDLLGLIYQKKNIDIEDLKSLTVGDMIFLNTYLSQDFDCLMALKNLSCYTFWMSPQRYFCLLWLGIPKKLKVPRFRFFKKKSQVADVVKIKVMEVMNWSEKEYSRCEQVLGAEFKKNEKHWREYLGL